MKQRDSSIGQLARAEKELHMLSLKEIINMMDAFYYDMDPYLYFDDVKSREGSLIRIKNFVSDPISASKCLQEILDVKAERLLPTIDNYADLRDALSKYIRQWPEDHATAYVPSNCSVIS